MLCSLLSNLNSNFCRQEQDKISKTAALLGMDRTVDNLQIGQVFEVRGYCGDGRAVIQPNSFDDTEQLINTGGLSGPGGCPI
jgi:hypothetical protein